MTDTILSQSQTARLSKPIHEFYFFYRGQCLNDVYITQTPAATKSDSHEKLMLTQRKGLVAVKLTHID